MKIKTIGQKYSEELYAKTKQYQKKYNFELGVGSLDTHNNEADAFKHTFGAADIAVKSLNGISKTITDFHELQGNFKNGQPMYEENMDRWNNLEGRKIAQQIKKEYSEQEIKHLSKTGKLDDIIAEKVMQKMRRGDLITNPLVDKRKYIENSFMDKIFKLENRIFHKSELKMNDLENPQIKEAFLDQITDWKPFPTKESLDKRVVTGELVYVENYTRSDGTKVNGYYRTYPKK